MRERDIKIIGYSRAFLSVVFIFLGLHRQTQVAVYITNFQKGTVSHLLFRNSSGNVT